jgi:hypothetical protein
MHEFDEPLREGLWGVVLVEIVRQGSEGVCVDRGWGCLLAELGDLFLKAMDCVLIGRSLSDEGL